MRFTVSVIWLLIAVTAGPAAAVVIASVALILALLVMISGIYVLERRYWGLSLAGSIVAALTGGMLGIASLVLIALSRDEFDRPSG